MYIYIHHVYVHAYIPTHIGTNKCEYLHAYIHMRKHKFRHTGVRTIGGRLWVWRLRWLPSPFGEGSEPLPRWRLHCWNDPLTWTPEGQVNTTESMRPSKPR